MVRMHIACYETEREYLVSCLLQLARTENASSIAVNQQPQQQFRRVWWRTLVTVLIVNRGQIKLGNHIDNESSQMVWRQPASRKLICRSSVFS